MIAESAADLRDLTYPEIYLPPAFSDEEMERSLRPTNSPKTKQGKEISDGIVKVAKERADAPSPCRFPAWDGQMGRDRHVSVDVVEVESGVKLIGPAGFNALRVQNGNIMALPPGKEGYKADGLTYIRCLADYVASRIEREAAEGALGTRQVRVGNVRSASDVYLTIPMAVRRFVESNNKKIDIRGPMFAMVEYTIR
jgi:O-phosphoseryl-tRNA synthetase